MRQRLDDLDDALRHRIEDSAVIAGEAADDDAGMKLTATPSTPMVSEIRAP